jgi:hypothetical protein
MADPLLQEARQHTYTQVVIVGPFAIRCTLLYARVALHWQGSIADPLLQEARQQASSTATTDLVIDLIG